MLKGIDPLLTAELLHALASAGHGDRIAIVDANFPAASVARRLVRLPGSDAPRALEAILSLLPVDTFEADPIAVMQVVGEPDAIPAPVQEIAAIVALHGAPAPVAVERHAFYAATAEAFVFVQTGETAVLRQRAVDQGRDPSARGGSGAAMRVDAHHHVWRIGRGDYGWIKPGDALHRDCTLADLRPLLGDIQATVLVQAAPTEAETAYLLNVARNSGGLVRGVVGWEDLSARDAPTRIAGHAHEPLLKGIRPMLQDIADSGWILQAGQRAAMHAIEDADLCFDALIQPRHLPAIRGLCARHPGLKLVVDHGAKPAIASGSFQPWADDIAGLARESRAWCKLSGLVTEAGPSWRVDDLRRYVNHLLGCFGPSRLIWGSDWPVVDLAGGYAAWRDATMLLLRDLSDQQREAILGDNAVAFYGL